jgi:hypothetical protein
MTALAEAPRFPEARHDDNDDVAWALQTAAVQWNRGGRADAIVWLRRAVDTAIDLGLHERAQELNRMTEALDSFVQAGGEFGPVGTGPQSSGTASSNEVDALLEERSDLPSVELGAYEVASPSLVDAVELEEAISDEPLDPGAELVAEVDVEVPIDEAEVAAEEEEIEELDEVELLDEDELEPIEDEPSSEPDPIPLVAQTESRPRPPPPPSPLSSRAPPPPRSAPPLPRRSSVPPVSTRSAPPASARSSAPSASSKPTAPPSQRVAPSEPTTFPPSERVAPSSRPSVSPPSQPAVEAYREERSDETTHRRSSPFAVETSAPSEPSLERSSSSSPPASKPYFEEDEMPTGVRELSPASLAAIEASVAQDEPLGGDSAEVTIEEPSSFPEPVLAEREREPSLADDELYIPDSSPEPPLVTTEAPAAPESEAPVVVAAEAVPAEPEPEPEPSGEPAIGGIVLASVRGLEDLPPETQEELVAKARIEKLGPEEEVSAFGLALVLKGDVAVMPAIADVISARAGVGEPVFTAGNLKDGVDVRVVAQGEGAEVAVWQTEDFEGAMASCPWVADELREVADRFQALAGAMMGPLGEGLDDMMRAMVVERTVVKRLEAGELLVEKGKPLPGLHIVGAGRLEVDAGGELLPGDFLFASSILGGGATPQTVHAGEQGALVLFIDRMTTHELMMSVPPLLELLASS